MISRYTDLVTSLQRYKHDQFYQKITSITRNGIILHRSYTNDVTVVLYNLLTIEHRIPRDLPTNKMEMPMLKKLLIVWIACNLSYIERADVNSFQGEITREMRNSPDQIDKQLTFYPQQQYISFHIYLTIDI